MKFWIIEIVDFDVVSPGYPHSSYRILNPQIGAPTFLLKSIHPIRLLLVEGVSPLKSSRLTLGALSPYFIYLSYSHAARLGTEGLLS